MPFQLTTPTTPKKRLGKKDLIRSVARDTGLTWEETRAAIDAVFQAITDQMLAGGRTFVEGFGHFEPAQHRLTGYDFKQRQALPVQLKTVPVWLPCDRLRQAMARGDRFYVVAQPNGWAKKKGPQDSSTAQG